MGSGATRRRSKHQAKNVELQSKGSFSFSQKKSSSSVSGVLSNSNGVSTVLVAKN